MTSNAKTALRALVSLVLIAIIVYNIDWRELGATITTVKLWPIGLSLAFNAIGVALSTIKWQWFLGLHRIPESFGRLHTLYYVGFFFSNFLPSMVGGDALRVLNTAQPSRFAPAVAAVMGERGTGFAVMLVLAGAAGAINFTRDVPVGLDWLALVLLAACAAGATAVVTAMALRRRERQSRWAQHAARLVEAVLVCLRSPAVLSGALFVSILFHILLVANAYLFCYSLGLNIDVLALAVVFPVAMLIAMLPVSLNGLGVKEGALIVLLGQLGVSPEQALVVALLSRLFIIIASLIGGLIFAINGSVRVSLVREPPAVAAAREQLVTPHD